LAGAAGDDTLDGGGGQDNLDGGADDDVLIGGSGNDTIAGGAGNDTLTGGADDDTFVLSAGGGSDAITDFAAGDSLNVSGLSDVGNALTNQDGTVTADEVIVSGGGGSDQTLTFPSGESVTVPDGTVDTSTPSTQFASLVAMGVPPCFAPGTRILTATGEMPVEDLSPGDLIATADHGLRPLRWIGRRIEKFSARTDAQKPIELKAGSMGNGLPRRDLIVSPLHRMVLDGRFVHQLHKVSEVLAPAKALVKRPDIRRMQGKKQITYYSLLFDRHEVIFAEGAATESFRPGPIAMGSFEAHIKEQVFAIYPLLREDPEKGLGQPARMIVTRRQAEEILARELAEGAEVESA